MTMARSLFHNAPISVQFPEDPPEFAKRYHVILRKVGNRKMSGIQMGTVVTFLPIDDWCVMNGYIVETLYGQLTQAAKPGEKTDLF